MQSNATTVEEYLASLPEDRRRQIAEVRRVILENLPPGYEESMNWGMIAYEVPLSVHPETYNGEPLPYAALASQKNHMAVYLTGVYMNEDRRRALADQFAARGKKLDAGKSCVRFKRIEDLPLDLIGECIAADPMDEFIARFDALRAQAKKQTKSKTKSAKSKGASRKKTASGRKKK